jgi:hypothetical protein
LLDCSRRDCVGFEDQEGAEAGDDVEYVEPDLADDVPEVEYEDELPPGDPNPGMLP